MPNSPRCVERSIRIYGSLIKAYPASFRKEYGSEMIGVFRDLATDAWLRRRRVGLLVLWLRVIADLVRTAPKQHLSRWNDEGENAMTFRSLLTREVTSIEADQRWSQIAVLVGAIVITPKLVSKLMELDPTKPQLFFGILLIAALALQFLGLGLLLSWVGHKNRPRFYLSLSLGQIVIMTLSCSVMVFGVRTLASMALTEYELFFGMMLTFQVTMAGCFLGEILPIAQAALADRREKRNAGA